MPTTDNCIANSPSVIQVLTLLIVLLVLTFYR